HKGDPFLLRGLKWGLERALRVALRHPWPIIAAVAVLGIGSKLALGVMDSNFLPRFNEGTLTIGLESEPGTRLNESGRIATQVEGMLFQVREVVSVARRTGRAEGDEHAEGVNVSELEVTVREQHRPRPGIHYAILRAIPGLHGWGVEKVGRPMK